ncbi:MAG TPA: acetyl-CoA carboxylase biotin carboxyl carrier protein [Steroidobacteraceae bacterium]|jgi:acetyl-CoA carboxylase biotin carboxyl carrier protein|nr:acetyl-CoA carboxylase biotin carboxyl carrier protein [Steroidobacteraceae bacterium]
MDIRKVKKLIELLEESGIAELEISEGEESVRISRHPRVSMAAPMAAPVLQPAAPAPAAAASPAKPATAAGEHKPRHDDQTITSPMVGTYYSASAPGAKSFVELGQEIKVGQILCIIEAMKMMNQIESDKAGRITAILAKNGEPVEFGQPLFIIE